MTPAPKRILVPTDFSPSSESALGLANELAGFFAAEIHLLHVRTVVDNPVVSPDDLGEVERILAMSDARAQQTLEDTVDGLGVPCQCHIRRGIAPVAAILDTIAEQHCDLVIMGTHGRRGLKGMLVGSVAKEVIHRSPVPVLTTRALTGGGVPIKKILVGYDSSEHSLQAVLMAAEWASLLTAEITLLHVMEPITYPDFYAHYTPRETQMKQITQACREALDTVGSEQLSGVPHTTEVIHARAAEGIAEHALTEGFDLVVLATRGLSGLSHALFGSVADRVTQLSEVPVLTVRGPRRTSRAVETRDEKPAKRQRKKSAERVPPASFSVERSQDMTVVRLHERESLAGTDLRLIGGLWDFLDSESRDPRSVVVALAPPGLLDPRNLERLLGGSADWNGPTTTEIRARIIREENVIQRFIQAVRKLDSFVIGVASGNIAIQLAAPVLACDYRIVSSDTVFVNTMQTLPRAPLGCLPWLLTRMVGGAKATQILLDVPQLSANDALELGLVNHVAEPNRLEDESFEVAHRLCSLHRATLVALKRATTSSSEDFQTYLAQELALVEQLASPRWREQRPT